MPSSTCGGATGPESCVLSRQSLPATTRLRTDAFNSEIEFADDLSSAAGTDDAVTGSLARTQPGLWTLRLEHDVPTPLHSRS